MGVVTGTIRFAQDFSQTFYGKWQVDLSNASITEPETGARRLPVDEIVAPTTETALADPVVEEVLPAAEPETIVEEAPTEEAPAPAELAAATATT